MTSRIISVYHDRNMLNLLSLSVDKCLNAAHYLSDMVHDAIGRLRMTCRNGVSCNIYNIFNLNENKKIADRSINHVQLWLVYEYITKCTNTRADVATKVEYTDNYKANQMKRKI